jgi:hypothetical protein
MTIQLAFLDPGSTLALPAHGDARIRVLDGLVWLTTSGSLEDVWLRAGEEHCVSAPGLTVLESTGRASVALIEASRHFAIGVREDLGADTIRRQIMNRYETVIPRIPFGIGAALMTAIVFGLLVILPAKMELDAAVEVQANSRPVTSEPIAVVVSDSQVTAATASQWITPDSSSAPPPSVIQ